jgi:hypothetical protein
MRIVSCLSILLLCPALRAVGAAEPQPSTGWAFYAFQNGASFGSSENEAKVLKELGYAGISQVFITGDQLAEKVAAYDKVGVKVLSARVPSELNTASRIPPGWSTLTPVAVPSSAFQSWAVPPLGVLVGGPE